MKLCNTKYFEFMFGVRERLYLFATLHLYFPFCKAVYGGTGTPLSQSLLMTAPRGSLGEGVKRFLKKNKIAWMPGYEAHDIKHALLGYRACFIHELRMQYFEFGNGNRSLPMWTVIIFGTLMAPDAWQFVGQDIRRGKRSKKVDTDDLVLRLNAPLQEVRKEYGLC